MLPIIISVVVVVILSTIVYMNLKEFLFNKKKFKIIILKTGTIYMVEENFLSKFKDGSFWKVIDTTGRHICTVSGNNLPISDDEKKIISNTLHLLFTKGSSNEDRETTYESLIRHFKI